MGLGQPAAERPAAEVERSTNAGQDGDRDMSYSVQECRRSCRLERSEACSLKGGKLDMGLLYT